MKHNDCKVYCLIKCSLAKSKLGYKRNSTQHVNKTKSDDNIITNLNIHIEYILLYGELSMSILTLWTILWPFFPWNIIIFNPLIKVMIIYRTINSMLSILSIEWLFNLQKIENSIASLLVNALFDTSLVEVFFKNIFYMKD